MTDKISPDIRGVSIDPAEIVKFGSLVIKPASAEEELAYLKDELLPRHELYLKAGYKPILPNLPIIEEILKEGTSHERISKLDSEFKDYYNSDDYREALMRTNEALAPVWFLAMEKFQEWNKKWGFKIFSQYQVRVSLYGAGGDYFPSQSAFDEENRPVSVLSSPVEDTAVIMMRATRDGSVSRKEHQMTPLHEAVHLGIEEIVRKYNLTRKEIERLVDNLLILGLKDLVASYKMQSSGDEKIDYLFKDGQIPEDLPEQIEKYISKNPRISK